MNECFKNIIEINNVSNYSNNEFFDETEKINNAEEIFSLYNNNIDSFQIKFKFK